MRIEPHEEKGAWLVAMNGHSMGVFHDETAEDVRDFLLVPSKGLISACKPTKGFDRALDIDDLGNSKVMSGALPLYVEPMPVSCSGLYPDWKRLFSNQKTGPVSCIGFDPLEILHFKGLGVLRFDFSGDNEGFTWVSATAHANFKGVIMPMKLAQAVEEF